MKIFCKINPTVRGERVSLVVLVVKNLPAYAGDIRKKKKRVYLSEV